MRFTTILFCFVLLINIYAQDTTIVIPASTVIAVKTIHDLSGEQLKAGQEVSCVVASDVVIDDFLVIPAGTNVFCQVENSEGSGMVGQGGNISISIQNTKTIDGRNIMLTGSFRNKGESSVGTSVAVGVVLCPLALLSSGEAAVIPAGTQTRAFTIGETKVKVKILASNN